MTKDKISHSFIICNGEPSIWSVCSEPNVNSRESAEKLMELIQVNHDIVERLIEEVKNLPQCFSKECMGCEVDMQRHLLTKILGDKK